MTESAAFANKAREDCMKDLGVEEFEVVETLDSITCDYCQSMDGKHFPMDDFMIGVTAPPFHPECRGCTCPYFDDEFTAGGERAARGADGKTYYVPSDMTYEEWKNAFVDGNKNDTDKIEVVDKLEKSSIIKIKQLKKQIQRKEKNIGIFEVLDVPMQKKSVIEIASKYGVDIFDITIKIQRNNEFITLPLMGSTDYKNIGRIDLFPNAFMNEEQLVRTLIHEKCHVRQLKKYGVKFVQDNLAVMEKEAYAFEDFWFTYLKKRVK